ncbi:hypothetical protein CFR79_06420 [Komagataeibacter saccharivorans]|nr:hypothetical protein CFR79_06420 [Komagataeibacter saccharivorans]
MSVNPFDHGDHRKNTPAIAIQWRSMCGIIYFRPTLATGLLNTVLILADPLPAISTGMHRPPHPSHIPEET